MRPKVHHDDEPTVQYAPGYQILEFPFFQWYIQMKVADEWNQAILPEVYIRILDDDMTDVTAQFMQMKDSPGFIRPTLYNLRRVMDILEENLEDAEDDATTIDTSGTK